MSARKMPPAPATRERWEWQSAPVAPAIPVLSPGPVVLVDTREQAPLEPWMLVAGKRFTLATQRATVPSGDYTIAGLEQHVAVERKSIADLVGTLVGSRVDSVGDRAGALDRFRRELDRLRAIPFRLLLIEGRREDIWAHRYESRALPVSIINLVDSFVVDYALPTIWAGNREESGRILGFTLHRIWAQAQPEHEDAKKAAKRGLAEHLPWCAKGAP